MADSEKVPSQITPAEPPAEKPVKVKKEKRAKKEKTKKISKPSNDIFLPVLVEFSYTFSVITLILLFLAVVSISVLTGASLIDTVIRTSVSMMAVGSLLLLLTRQLTMDVLNASILEKKEKEEQEQKEQEEKELAQQENLNQKQNEDIEGFEEFKEFKEVEEMEGVESQDSLEAQ